jgi:hypothetical protein
VCYEAVNGMLLNEFLKEHKKVEGQQATIAELVATFFAAIRSLFSHARERWLRVVKRGRVGAQ